MGRRKCAQLVLCCHLVTLGTRVHSFVSPLTRTLTSTGRGLQFSARRCCPPYLYFTRSRRLVDGVLSAAAEGEENGTGLDAETKRRKMTRAPLRITPNFQPQEKRRPKTDVKKDLTYGAFLTEESLDIAAMAWAEFSDWLRRTVERNVNGAKFEFDVRQWSSSIRKWCIRAVEMDVQAKAELLRLYDLGMLDRDGWGQQAVKVDDRVEDEWDNIYVDCQDGYDSIASTTSNAPAAPASTPTAMYADAQSESGAKGLDASGPSSFELYGGGVDEEGEERGYEDDEMLEGEGEGAEEAAEGEGFNDEDIIDCAIKGRWTFDNNDDPVRISQDSPGMCCVVLCSASRAAV